MTFNIVSVNALIIYFEQEISETILDEVQATYEHIKNIEGITDLTPSYCSILVQFDIFMHDHESLKRKILQAAVDSVLKITNRIDIS